MDCKSGLDQAELQLKYITRGAEYIEKAAVAVTWQ